MTDKELIARLRSQLGDDVQHVYDREVLFRQAADRIEALTVENAKLHDHIEGVAKDTHKIMVGYEAKLAENEVRLRKAGEGLTVIDALDPEGLVNGCSQSALIGLVLRMGEIARATLAEISSEAALNKGESHD